MTTVPNAATYLQERNGFSYPKFALEHGVSTPDGFWSFWVHYYQSPKEHREQLKSVSYFTEWSELLWSVYQQAEKEIKNKSKSTASPNANAKKNE